MLLISTCNDAQNPNFQIVLSLFPEMSKYIDKWEMKKLFGYSLLGRLQEERRKVVTRRLRTTADATLKGRGNQTDFITTV